VGLFFKTKYKRLKAIVDGNSDQGDDRDNLYSTLDTQGDVMYIAKKNVVAARKNTTFSNILDAVGSLLPIKCEMKREAKIIWIAKDIKLMEWRNSDLVTTLYWIVLWSAPMKHKFKNTFGNFPIPAPGRSYCLVVAD